VAPGFQVTRFRRDSQSRVAGKQGYIEVPPRFLSRPQEEGRLEDRTDTKSVVQGTGRGQALGRGKGIRVDPLQETSCPVLLDHVPHPAATRCGDQEDAGKPGPETPMKVLLGAHVFFPGHSAGTEILTLELARGLRMRGHRTDMVAGEREEGVPERTTPGEKGGRFDDFSVPRLPYWG